MTSVSFRRRTALVAVAALALPLTACGSDTLNTGGGGSSSGGGATGQVTASKDDSLAAKVPAAVKSKGTLTIGSDASYAPNEFLPVGSQTITGMDVDLFNAVAATLGLKTNWQNAKFSNIIPGLGTKYDVGVSSFTINKERLQTVTMVSYLTAGVQWAVPKGNPKKIDPTNPCGLTVGVQTGTVEQDELNALNKAKCKSKPIKIVPEDDQTKVNLDLQTGKVDAMSADSPVTQYAVKQSNGKLETVGEVTEAAPYGIVLPKAQTDFGTAIAGALDALKKNGTYDNILKKWGLKTGAVDKFEVNPQVSG
ncbi:ABC transporter substrate-binding protein [Calidifontibacter sp. DB0510]|uniref:ABC transporter substrate-binding protein n=1 Tax=Metallococcus carri TaxID=1656884 RepID=A0A967EF89_9MICO|nr:ABC transporter substrate-binding protein [Metallococcus carri]NHN56416.1 ABC transporter substrate-binding protein [Metallococcus carri]NOP36040.1 ABC transporter substrate-binding protein [Calidifontibacter sp. DB2511S]